MGISKRVFVSCERIEEKARIEAVGPLNDVLSLIVQLLVNVSSGTAETGFMGIKDPTEIVLAICSAAIESLDEIGGK
jgi:hypothetical protein